MPSSTSNASRSSERLAQTQQSIDTQRALVSQLEATIQADQADIESAQTQLDYTTIKAPLSGRTGIRLIDQGNIVHATDTTGLVVITQLQPISVIFTLPDDQLEEIFKEMAAGPLKTIAVGAPTSSSLGKVRWRLSIIRSIRARARSG